MSTGGNGQLTTSSSIAVTAGTQYTIVVGAGGTTNNYGEYGTGNKGGNSTAFGLTGTGGGAASNSSNGSAAGNGSGGAGGNAAAGSAGWVNFSYNVVVTTPEYCKVTVGTS